MLNAYAALTNLALAVVHHYKSSNRDERGTCLPTGEL